MAIFKVGDLVGSLLMASINRKLAGPLIRLLPDGMVFPDISFAAMPLYNYDLEKDSRRFQEHD